MFRFNLIAYEPGTGDSVELPVESNRHYETKKVKQAVEGLAPTFMIGTIIMARNKQWCQQMW